MVKLPFGVCIDNLIDEIRNISWEACEILLYYSQILKDPKNKSNIIQNNDDPVTLADLKVNEFVIKRINEKYKNVSWEILSEENVKQTSQNYDLNTDWLWILDPLDGTKDFIQGTNDYAMHLALNYKKRPYLGFVLIPGRDELWIAFEDKVWGEKRDGSKINLNLSKNKNLEDMILVKSKNHINKTLSNLIKKINFHKVVEMGSIGCKIGSLLRGESDLYICLSLPKKSSPKDWDFAAPEAILRAAGGEITNIENIQLSYGKPKFEQKGIIIASSNKIIHKEICLQIKEVLEKHNLYPEDI